MKHLLYTVAAAALATGFALPAAAQSDAMDVSATTCAEFLAMAPDEQSHALEAMHMASDKMAADGMASDDMASDDMAADGMASDDMASDGMASDDMAADGMASDEMAADDMMKQEVMALISACDGHPDMMAMDAMMSSADK